MTGNIFRTIFIIIMYKKYNFVKRTRNEQGMFKQHCHLMLPIDMDLGR